MYQSTSAFRNVTLKKVNTFSLSIRRVSIRKFPVKVDIFFGARQMTFPLWLWKTTSAKCVGPSSVN